MICLAIPQVVGVEVNNNSLLNAINANDNIQLQEALMDISSKQLNKKGKGGQTPLMFAAMSGKDNVIQLLLEAGNAMASVPSA